VRCWSSAACSGPPEPEKIFDRLWNPSRGCLGVRDGRKMLDDNKAIDFAPQEGVQEGGVVAEGHATIRLAVGTEHVRMCKHAIATKHLAVVDRNKANGTDTMKTPLAHREVIDLRRRCPPPTLHVDIAGIVHIAAEAGMPFQPVSVGQVDRMRGDIIDRSMAVDIGGRAQVR
jgi:hypothetical protein